MCTLSTGGDIDVSNFPQESRKPLKRYENVPATSSQVAVMEARQWL